MFKELTGKTLSRDQLVDWSIKKGLNNMTVEDIIYKALDARANITKLSKKYIEGMEEKMNEKKITVEKLLELCKQFGTDKVAEGIIAEKTGCAVLTIRTYIHKWGIKAMLKAMEEKDAAKEQEKPVMIIDDVTLFKANVEKLDKIKPNVEEVKQEDPQPAPPEAKDKPTGRLLPVSLRGLNHIYDISETDKKVIVFDKDMSMEFVIPFDQFPDFAAEVSNFNNNYLRRFL